MRQDIALDNRTLETVERASKNLDNSIYSIAQQLKLKNQIELLKLENEVFSNGDYPPHTMAWNLGFKEAWRQAFGRRWERS